MPGEERCDEMTRGEAAAALRVSPGEMVELVARGLLG